MVKGFCSVCCDILHIGHIDFLCYAAQKCDHLTVGVMTDESILQYKKRMPIITQEERVLIVKNLFMVNEVILQHSYYEINQIIDEYNIDIFIESEQHDRSVHGKCKKIYAPYYPYQSSSKIKDKVIREWRRSL